MYLHLTEMVGFRTNYTTLHRFTSLQIVSLKLHLTACIGTENFKQRKALASNLPHQSSPSEKYYIRLKTIARGSHPTRETKMEHISV